MIMTAKPLMLVNGPMESRLRGLEEDEGISFCGVPHYKLVKGQYLPLRRSGHCGSFCIKHHPSNLGTVSTVNLMNLVQILREVYVVLHIILFIHCYLLLLNVKASQLSQG